jgi:hypothetical protein
MNQEEEEMAITGRILNQRYMPRVLPPTAVYVGRPSPWG